MSKFTAYAEYTTIVQLELEADTLEEAIELANDSDGGDWEPIDFDGWHITDVIPLGGELKND